MFVVDSLRQVGESLLYSHEMPGRSQGGRVEFLPVCYHSALGQDPSAVDKLVGLFYNKNV